MKKVGCSLNSRSLFTIVAAFLWNWVGVAAVAIPESNCYAIDNSSRLVDFMCLFSPELEQSSWIGATFVYEGQNSDVVVRFCKDVESRSQAGYVGFGRFDKFNYFVAGSGHINFIQEFYHGDLMNCEYSLDKMGRTSEVNILCGSCSNGDKCKVGGGCICNVTYESTCRAFVELAISCEKPGPRIFKGFTVGFHPRSWEIVYNGMTQLGYEKAYHDFRTEQSHVVLYVTAIASLSTLVHKPIVQVFPVSGLEVRLSGSGAVGKPPTTLSPSVLLIDWRCVKVRNTPYEVNITIPVDGYEPIIFFLTKMCEYTQDQSGDSTNGWAAFGVISFIFIVSSTLFCCGGFVYKTRVERQSGIDALPGMAVFSACLETVSGAAHSYSRPSDLNAAFASEASWERPPVSPQETLIQSERKYCSF